MKQYIIRAALHEEANEGWVWVSEFSSRTIVQISNNVGDRVVFCQVRTLDDNFRKFYNDDPKNLRIPLIEADTIVMSQWFRDGLGRINSTDEDNETGKVALKIVEYKHWRIWLGSFRAASHHPDIIVRLGTRLGMLGVLLGLAGVGFPLVDMIYAGAWFKFVITLVLVLVSAWTGWWICKSPDFRPTSNNGD